MIRKPYIFLTGNYAENIVNQEQESMAGLLKNMTIQSFPFETEFYFNDKYGDFTNRKIDTIIVKNTNLVNATIEALNNAGEYETIFEIENNTDSTILIKNDSLINTSKIKITIPENGNPQEVDIEQIGLYSYVCDLFALTENKYTKKANRGSYRTLDGTIVFYSDYDKWEASIKIDNLPKHQFDAITNEIDLSNNLTIIPFEDFDANAIYDSYVNPEYTYNVNRKTALYSLSIEAKQK